MHKEILWSNFLHFNLVFLAILHQILLDLLLLLLLIQWWFLAIIRRWAVLIIQRISIVITTTAIRLAFIFDSPTDIANTLLLLATTTYFRSTTTITSSDIFIKHRTDLNRFLNLSLLGSTFNHHLLYFFNFYILDNQFINRHCFCFHKKRFKCLLNLIIRR